MSEVGFREDSLVEGNDRALKKPIQVYPVLDKFEWKVSELGKWVKLGPIK